MCARKTPRGVENFETVAPDFTGDGFTMICPNHRAVLLEGEEGSDLAYYCPAEGCDYELPRRRGKELITYVPPGAVARQGGQICPFHNALCDAKTETVFTRYSCPVPLCSFGLKVPRPKAKPPEQQEEFGARP